MMVCATSSTIRNPAPPRPLLLSMAITAASRPARRRSAPTSVVALDRQKARLGYAGNTHRQPTQPDRGPARRLIWPAKPGQLPNFKYVWLAFRLVRAGAILGVSFAMIDPLHVKARMKFVPRSGLVGVDSAASGDATANDRNGLGLMFHHCRQGRAASLAHHHNTT